MSAKSTCLVLSTFLVLVLVTCGSLLAKEQSKPSPDKKPATGEFPAILGALSRLQIPSLAGLIQPETMGLLSGNRFTPKDNEAHLLSGNEAEVELLSGNEARILSDISILSGFSINVEITVQEAPEMPKSKKGNGMHRGRKAKRKSGSRAK